MHMTPDLYVHQSLKILGQGLEPHIRAVLKAHLGNLEWTEVLRVLDEDRGKHGYTYDPQDVALQLRMVTERLGNLGFPFSATDKHRTLGTYGGVLRLVRNQVAHHAELSVLDALRAVDTVRIVLDFIGDGAGVSQIMDLRHQVINELVKDHGPDELEAQQEEPVPPESTTGTEEPTPAPERIPTEEDEEVDVRGGVQETVTDRPRGARSLKWEPWEVEVVGEPEMLESLKKLAHRESVRGVIETVVDAEGPIHRDRLVSLVCQAHGAKRATAAKRKKVEHQIGNAEVQVDADGFVWPQGLDVDRWLLARRSTPAQRRIDEVSPVELANALEVVLSRHGSLPMDEAKQAVLKFFGRVKTNKSTDAQLGRSLLVAQQRGRVALEGEQLVSAAVPA
ncbi:hypothetical protein BJF77_00430 [Kocuria sp. CNJ-770]|nr:DUF3320 domain-containing protein [Kocuria sp. CNJ-770]OLT10235.1 hypothetical protein BJF77_00430 [Kocuria sp. CNJ-770]